VKQDCLLCERTAPDHNLYCQEIYCPAEMSPTILDYGDWLGNIEIVKPMIVLRSAALYEARYLKKKVLLKVAHPGREHRDRLKREAEFFKSIRSDKTPPEFFPVWLPPYGITQAKDDDPYGKIVLNGHLLYYCLFEYFNGEPLRDILTKKVNLWVYHIGWIMVRLASAVTALQSKGLFHFGLSPDSVLVQLDDESGAPGALLFDLGVISDQHSLSAHWNPAFVAPAYTAPELIEQPTPQPSYGTDVYGLGLILYELLVGQPAFPFKLYSDDEVYDAVRHTRRARMTRSEDVKRAADIALTAVNQTISARYPNAAEMTKELKDAFGAVPEKKRRLNLILALLIVGAILAIALLIAVSGARL
jgi:serine/threonine protein kinase